MSQTGVVCIVCMVMYFVSCQISLRLMTWRPKGIRKYIDYEYRREKIYRRYDRRGGGASK